MRGQKRIELEEEKKLLFVGRELPEDKQVTPDWFRSNILIKTDSDEPFQEDEWKGKMK